MDQEPTAENIRAAELALNGWDPTYGALFSGIRQNPSVRGYGRVPLSFKSGLTFSAASFTEGDYS